MGTASSHDVKNKTNNNNKQQQQQQQQWKGRGGGCKGCILKDGEHISHQCTYHVEYIVFI